MTKFKIIGSVFVIGMLCQAHKALKLYDRLVYVQQVGSIVQHTFRDGRLLYTTCEYYKNELKCNVSREKSAYRNDTYICNYITFKSEQPNGTMNSRMFLDSFGRDKVLVGWEDNDEYNNKYIKYSIIALNDCKYVETKLIANNNQSLTDYQVLIYEDTFHVIFANDALCGVNKLCRVTIDANGKLNSGPESYFENIGHTRYFKTLQNGRYFFIRRKNAETSYHLMKSDGSIKILTRVRNMLPPYYTSVSHNLFGICYTIQLSSMFDTETKCVQYNDNGDLKLDISMKNLNRTKMMRYMHNLSQGGFIFIDEDYANCEPDRCWIRFVAEKRNAMGTSVGCLDLGIRCEDAKSRASTSFFENDDHDYCLAWTCRLDASNEIYITVKCFNDTDFT